MFVLGMRELYPSISRPGKVVGHGHYFSTLSTEQGQAAGASGECWRIWARKALSMSE